MATEVHPLRDFLVLLGLSVVTAVLWYAATGHHKHNSENSAVPLGNSVTVATPSGALPTGTVSGHCAQASVPKPSQGHAADMHGNANVNNTGNIGITVTVTMTWPQSGRAPIKMTKKSVRVDYGQTLSLPFNRPVNQAQLASFKDWQDHQNEQGCTYSGTITSTFGAVH